MNNDSKNHHYIPQYFIKGFQSEEGYYYVYDKLENKIIRNRATKRIFCEEGRNSISNQFIKEDIIEDYYQPIDNKFAPIIATLNKADKTTGVLTIEQIKAMEEFIYIQFCRCPIFDKPYEEINYKQWKEYVDKNPNPTNLKDITKGYMYSTDLYTKTMRFKLAVEGIKITPETDKDVLDKATLTIFPDNHYFLLGDFQMVYENLPNSLDKMTGINVILPISSKRALSIVDKEGFVITYEKAIYLNTMIIEQSIRYVCSADKAFLETCIAYHREAKYGNPIGSVLGGVLYALFYD